METHYHTWMSKLVYRCIALTICPKAELCSAVWCASLATNSCEHAHIYIATCCIAMIGSISILYIATRI